MRNVEIKAVVHDVDDILNKAKNLSNSNATIILQNDTFYNMQQGRLKLRKFKDGNAELIYYERPDIEGPKTCSYEKCDLDSKNVDGLNKVLTKAMGTAGTVKKIRNLFFIGQTRIHVDIVENLGNFMELEVVLQPEQTSQEGETIAYSLMEKLGIRKEDLLSGAYHDMLNK